MHTMTILDHKRISELLELNLLIGKHLELEKKLVQSSLIESQFAPADLVTMNSEILMRDVETSDEFQLRLVYQISPLYGNQVSVLAPLGQALLSTRENETVIYKGRDGKEKTVLIRKIIFQPESQGLDL